MTDSLMTRVGALEPLIVEHRAWAENNRKMAPSVFQGLCDTGVTRLFQPKSLGGLEVDPVVCCEVTQTLARFDTSAAWFVMVANASRLMASTWPESLIDTIWGANPAAIVAASGNQPFKGRRDGDGFVLNGVNGFVSGCDFADWLMSPMIVDDQRYMAVLPMADCEIIDNWHALGMRGTGSSDVAVHDLRIDGAFTVPFTDEQGEVNRYHTGALYRCPGRILFATYIPITLVLAEQALIELARLAQTKTPAGQVSKLKNRSIAQIKNGKATALYRSAKIYFMDCMRTAWERAETGGAATPQQKADLYLAGTHAVQASAQVVRWVADAAGTTVIYRDEPLQRIVRDMETLRHHGFANESRYGSVSQLMWGAELDYPLLLR